jgi:hypothetical protein
MTEKDMVDFDPYAFLDDWKSDAGKAATPATPATQDELSSENNELQTISSSRVAATQCYSTTTQTQDSSRVALCSKGVAESDIPEAFDIPGADSLSSRSSRSSSLSAPLPLTHHYPCAVCQSTDRWDDAGVWRCKACWPPGSLTTKASMATLLRCRRCGSADAPVPDAPQADGSLLLRCPECRLPRLVTLAQTNMAAHDAA